MPAIPLGIRDDGKYAALLDQKAMWPWAVQRCQSIFPGLNVKDCVRPSPPPPPGKKEPDFGAVGLEGAALDDLKQTGWAILFGPNTSPEIRKQLDPLIQFRKSEIDDPSLFKVWPDDEKKGGYQGGQSVDDWLGQFRVGSDTLVQPKAGVPYYVLIVASPEDIPFSFQYELDVYWAVGRLWLEKDEDYGAYARAVVAYEKAQQAAPTAKKLTYFAPNFARDNGATKLLCNGLVGPLRDRQLTAKFGFAEEFITGADATRDRLVDLYSGTNGRAAIYFCGSHGLLRGFDSDFLEDTQGALLCENWPGDTPPEKEQYMTGGDLRPESDLRGTMHFIFACYGGGWPSTSTYDGTPVAPKPMVARLPQTILAKGGLAVLAHIDRVWSYSFQAGNGIDRSGEIEDVLTRLMKGARAGHATDQFNTRWNVLGNSIAQKIASHRMPSTQTAHDLWIEHDDARNHVLYGDPAVCLRV